jgi:hypothetical protein
MTMMMMMMMIYAIYGDNAAEWCLNGSQTATTDECICSSHLGYFCKDSGSVSVNMGECQSGYGISFYSHSCKTCSCTIDTAWVERKKTALSNRKRQQQQPQFHKK